MTTTKNKSPTANSPEKLAALVLEEEIAECEHVSNIPSGFYLAEVFRVKTIFAEEYEMHTRRYPKRFDIWILDDICPIGEKPDPLKRILESTK